GAPSTAPRGTKAVLSPRAPATQPGTATSRRRNFGRTPSSPGGPRRARAGRRRPFGSRKHGFEIVAEGVVFGHLQAPGDHAPVLAKRVEGAVRLDGDHVRQAGR